MWTTQSFLPLPPLPSPPPKKKTKQTYKQSKTNQKKKEKKKNAVDYYKVINTKAILDLGGKG